MSRTHAGPFMASSSHKNVFLMTLGLVVAGWSTGQSLNQGEECMAISCYIAFLSLSPYVCL